MKRLLAKLDDLYYKYIIKNALKLSKLGRGFVVTGAEAGENYEYIYDNKAQGKFFIGKYIDRALLNLPSVQATQARKDGIKEVVWNEILNNQFKGQKTKILDLASGASRYLRELKEYHNKDFVESLCIDKNTSSKKLSEKLQEKEGISNIRFIKGDAFKLSQLKKFSKRNHWNPNLIIASGFFIYLNDQIVEKLIQEIYEELPSDGLLAFTSYENILSKKLMKKTMKTSDGIQWTLFYRKPIFWRTLLLNIGFKNIYITRDKWGMNNICWARK